MLLLERRPVDSSLMRWASPVLALVLTGFWVLPVVLLAGILSGALWAAIAAGLKTHLHCNEILTTIILNYIALNLLLYVVTILMLVLLSWNPARTRLNTPLSLGQPYRPGR